jgi:serine/threonine protein kinase
MPDVLERLKSALANRYAVESEVGRGGMATVYLAEDLKHGRQVAIKVLHPELASALGPDRFLREIQITARLQHPNILVLLDSGEADGLLYYVMPYVEGESLRELLERDTQLPLDEALRITREVADGLDYAHGQGVIHRDIKPANILLSGGHAVIADFGVAGAVEEAGGARITRTGMAVGTPAYMSPEQSSGWPGSRRSRDLQRSPQQPNGSRTDLRHWVPCGTRFLRSWSRWSSGRWRHLRQIDRQRHAVWPRSSWRSAGVTSLPLGSHLRRAGCCP